MGTERMPGWPGPSRPSESARAPPKRGPRAFALRSRGHGAIVSFPCIPIAMWGVHVKWYSPFGRVAGKVTA